MIAARHSGRNLAVGPARYERSPPRGPTLVVMNGRSVVAEHYHSGRWRYGQVLATRPSPPSSLVLGRTSGLAGLHIDDFLRRHAARRIDVVLHDGREFFQIGDGFGRMDRFFRADNRHVLAGD